MATSNKPAPFSLQDLYAAYPDSDLLPLDPKNLTPEAVEAAEGRPLGLGDTLFLFLVRDLCSPAGHPDHCDLDEQMARVRTARADLEAVYQALEQRREEDHVD